MKVKSVVIDGFKSYAHRQELSDMDQHFNAIVGLNGSGKSNVFDAICFVMGLRNVAKVRVERQEELIFKNGKAGIQRASVTIEFDNSDPATAPEHYPPTEFPTISVTRQIDTGLRQRFFFNGRLCDQDRVKEFFMHASLNIENPHFLVQQGQIHRLVGMKPADILGFIEEAAGTLVFDHSRRKAELQMRSKDKRLTEITASLDQEIGPRISAFQEQEREYEEFSDIQARIEEFRRFKQGLQLFTAENGAREAQTRLLNVSQTLQQLRQDLRDSEAEHTVKKDEMARIQEELTAPREELRALATEVGECKKSVAKTKSTHTSATKQANQLRDAVGKLEAEHQQSAEALRALESENTTAARHTELEDEVRAAEEKINDTQNAIRLQKNGLMAGTGGRTLTEEKAHLEGMQIKLEGDRKNLRMRLTRLDGELAQLTEELQSMGPTQQNRETEMSAARRELEAAEAVFKPHEAAMQRLQQLDRTLDQYRAKAQELLQRVRHEAPMVAPLVFRPIAQHPNLAQQHVLGRAGEHVRVTDEGHSFALSVGAGGNKLGQFIVTHGWVADEIIQKGELQQRVTFVALDSVQRPPAYPTPARIDAARAIADQMTMSAAGDGEQQQQQGGGAPCWAELATNLVSFDDRLRGVMDNLFGNFMVCSSLAVAKAIAYDERTRIKAVTLDGDVVDPNGVMAGGDNSQLPNMLREFVIGRAKVDAFREAERNYEAARAELAGAQQLRGEAQRAADRVDAAKTRLEEIEHYANDSRYGELQRHVAATGEQRAKLVRSIETEVPEKLQQIATRLDAIARTEGMDTEQRLGELQNELKEAQKKKTRLQQEMRSGRDAAEREQANRDALRARVDATESSLAERRAECEQVREEEKKAAEDLARFEQQLTTAQAKHRDVKARVDELTDSQTRIGREVDALQEEMHGMQKTLEKSISDHEQAERTNKEAEQVLRRLLPHAAWMTEQVRATFGDADGRYHFNDEARTRATLEQLETMEARLLVLSKQGLEKNRMMFESWSREHKKLLEQRATLAEDKQAIMQSIVEIERKKWVALDDVVRRVSEHFSALFHTCLDYATCRLAEQRDPESTRLLGLEVKVAFNGKEKASLTELSGGQRSLLALCLILSILRVHRAPVYILDEVDAALDPSHTQNLGLMLKTHFADAQFLLVSLKDGMFSSANVVYEVRNTQGFSEVTRKEARRRSG